ASRDGSTHSFRRQSSLEKIAGIESAETSGQAVEPPLVFAPGQRSHRYTGRLCPSARTRSQGRASHPSFGGILRVRANIAHAVGLRSSASTQGGQHVKGQDGT